MSSFVKFLKNLIQMLPWFKPSRVAKRRAERKVKREEESGGMDSIRDSIADTQRDEK